MPVFRTACTCLVLAAALTSCAPAGGPAAAGATPGEEIPIETQGGTILLPILVAPSARLRLRLDTGMGFDGVLLYQPPPDSSFPGPLAEVRIPGAGAGEPARGLMAESASFSAGPVRFSGQRVVWLTDGAMTGFSSDGIVGYSLFGHWTVEVDYDRSVIVLHRPGTFRPDSSWTLVPLRLGKNSMPWARLRADITGRDSAELDCYLDLADREEVVFLTGDSARFPLPDDLEPVYLGRGLSGDVSGWKGRAAWIQLDTFRFADVPVAFADAKVRSKHPGADAVIGAGLLGRFNSVYDYAGERLWIRPRAPRDK